MTAETALRKSRAKLYAEPRRWTARHIALRNILDSVRADLANDADYLTRHPAPPEELSPQEVFEVRVTMSAILNRLERGLPPWAQLRARNVTR